MGAFAARSFAPMSIHIGEEIERRRRATGVTKTELALRIGVDRSHIYTIISQPSIDTLVLRRVCLALDMNFFGILSGDMDESMGAKRDTNMVGEGAAVYGRTPKERTTPLRIVIEVDPYDEGAKQAAVELAGKLRDQGDTKP